MSHLLNSLYILIKPASSGCNLRCKYCFYEDESINRTQKSYGMMSEETAAKLIKSCVEATVDGATISFGFQGGEPTLRGLDFYKKFIEEEKKYPNRNFAHSIQTNGYVIDDEWATFLKKNNFLVGLSVDGYKELHDTFRINSEKAPTFERIAKSYQTLVAHNVDVNALCVVTGQCAEKPHRVYSRLKQMGFRYLQFIPCLDPLGKERGLEEYSLTPEAYGSFLTAVFDDWYRDWEKQDYVSVRLFEDYVHIMMGQMPSSCASSGKCGSYIVVEADGGLYPCDFYVLDNYYEGNVNNDSILSVIQGPKAQAFINEYVKRPAKCLACTWFNICHGGCKRDLATDPYFCDSFKFFFEYAYERLSNVVRAEINAR